MRLVRTWVRNEQASLRRPLAHEVVGIWRSEYFVGTSVHQNKALLKKEQKTHSSTRGLACVLFGSYAQPRLHTVTEICNQL